MFMPMRKGWMPSLRKGLWSTAIYSQRRISVRPTRASDVRFVADYTHSAVLTPLDQPILGLIPAWQIAQDFCANSGKSKRRGERISSAVAAQIDVEFAADEGEHDTGEVRTDFRIV